MSYKLKTAYPSLQTRGRGAVNISGTYDSRGNIINSKYFWSQGFDLSLIYGINFKLSFGYKHIHK